MEGGGNITIGMIVSCSGLGSRHSLASHKSNISPDSRAARPRHHKTENLPHSSSPCIPIPITREPICILGSDGGQQEWDDC